ncbi:hypothetical protein JXA85_01930 [Candidatus Woesearchaeota archaeon]|nr:hypothetical protein [Candidatus Woesearchaeota archaeon]
MERIIPISFAYLLGSFTTKKRRPVDVDLILLLKTKDSAKARWSVDLVLAPENKHGEFILKDTSKWMNQKYGKKKSAVIKLK